MKITLFCRSDKPLLYRNKMRRYIQVAQRELNKEFFSFCCKVRKAGESSNSISECVCGGVDWEDAPASSL